MERMYENLRPLLQCMSLTFTIFTNNHWQRLCPPRKCQVSPLLLTFRLPLVCLRVTQDLLFIIHTELNCYKLPPWTLDHIYQHGVDIIFYLNLKLENFQVFNLLRLCGLVFLSKKESRWLSFSRFWTCFNEILIL